MRGSVVLAGVFAVMALEGVAFAQGTPAKSAKDAKAEEWIFPDDKLLDVKDGANGMSVVGGHIPIRTLITRPRTHFVPEMLKTIENL